MTCAYCQAREKDWKGDDPVCGFTEDEFDSSNFRCATCNAIRDICDDEHRRNYHLTVTDSEQSYATIDISDIRKLWKAGEDSPNALYVGWYKGRGRTECMWLMYDTAPPRPPTIEEITAIINYYKKAKS